MTETLPMPMPGPLSPSQRQSLFNLIRRAARAEILPRFRRLEAHEIDQKSGPQDLVTEADRQAEQMIARGLARMFPGALIIGEETDGNDPDLRDKIAEAPIAFTIDPVDGTWNFARGLSVFGVIVSMTRLGVPVFGLLYDPVLDDFIWAEEHEAAMFTGRDRRTREVTTSKGGELADICGFIPLYLIPKDKRDKAALAFPKFQRAHTLRCSCHEFRTFATGGVDFIMCAGLTPWDHAAGALIAARAGGHVAMLDGSDFRADKQGVLLSAADEDTWNRVRDVFAFMLD